jgi:hypothetical protein
MRNAAPDKGAPSQTDWVEQIAMDLIGKGFETPSCLVLELFRPFSFLASQILLAVEPLLGNRLGRQSRQWQRLLEDRQALDALLARLEGARRQSVAAEEDLCKPSSR